MDDQRADPEDDMTKVNRAVAACPGCYGQGDVVAARLNATGEIIYLCDECDTLWRSKDDIGRGPCFNFANYVSQFGLKGLWTEITLLEEHKSRT